jgi:cytochrome c553
MTLLARLLAAAILAAPALHAFAQQQGAAPAAAPAAAASALAANATPAAPAGQVKVDAAAGGQRYAAVCAACHGPEGNSGIAQNPKLAQQFAEYTVKQLQEFKTDKRPSAIMKPFASQLSDQDMVNIAAFLASSKARPGFARDKALVSQGERIWRGGIPDRQIAACAGCHSPNGAGIPAQYPRLSGQHADYTITQLNKFRTAANVPNVKGDGARANSIQMMQIASRMTDQEIRAVADYVAGLR